MNEGKGLKGKLGNISYMQASLALGILCLVLSSYLFGKSILTGGLLTRTDGLLGVAVMLLSGCGFGIAIHGHFFVRLEGKLDYRLAAILNGIILLIYVFLYFFGL